MAGGNSGGVTSFLPIAAALAATVATDGAASPWLVDAMGTTAAGALTSGAAAAAASGLTAAVTGQNVGRSALMGGISGGIGGALAGYGAAAGAGTEAATTAAPALTGTNVAGTAAMAPEAYMGGASGAFVPSAGYSASLPAGLGAASPYAGNGIEGLNAMNGGNWWTEAAPQVTSADMAGINNVAVDTNAPAGGSNGIMDWVSKNKGIAAMGGTALAGALMQSSNNKYGTPTAASQKYNGPLSKLHYDPDKYTPLTTPQPSPAYQPKYANYVAQPYNAYAAQGGQVVSMAQGGIAGATPNTDGSGQMFDTNGVAQNQIYPQSTISSDAFSNATNTPIAQNIVSGTSDAAVDPYTGAQKFARGGIARYEEGGLANTPQAQPQMPQGVPIQAMPNMLTQNAFNTNNNLTQDLVARMAARNAANPMPGQTPPVAPMQPAGVTAAPYAYAAPTFTRPTDTPNIPFQNPKIIRGTAEWNAEQARIAAEAEAKRLAEEAAMPRFDPYANQNNGGGAAGGLMPEALKYAAGGGVGHLGGYAAGGNPRLLKGPGDGMSDNIPATIGGKQPARLADGEFVVPADVVSHLGNGSTDAGAKHLYNMMDKVRKARTGNKKQGKQIKADKFLKA